MLLVGFPKPKLLFHETMTLACSYNEKQSEKGAESRDFVHRMASVYTTAVVPSIVAKNMKC